MSIESQLEAALREIGDIALELASQRALVARLEIEQQEATEARARLKALEATMLLRCDDVARLQSRTDEP